VSLWWLKLPRMTLNLHREEIFVKSIYVQHPPKPMKISANKRCLLFSAFVESIVLRPAYFVGNATSALFVACFGAQALLGGSSY
jgi:hypothetical protein